MRVFGNPFRNSPWRRGGGLRAAVRGEHGGAGVPAAALPVVDRVSPYADVGARPEPLLRAAAHALRAVLAVAPVVAADVGPLQRGEGEKEDEKLEMKSIFKSSDRKNKAVKRGCCSCHNYGPDPSVMVDELQFA